MKTALPDFSGMTLSQLQVYGQEHNLKMRGRPPKDKAAAKLITSWRSAMYEAGYDGTGTLTHKKVVIAKHHQHANEEKAIDGAIPNPYGASLAGALPKDPIKRKAWMEYRERVKAIRKGGNATAIVGLDVPEPEMTDEETLDNTREKFDIMCQLVKGVAENGAPRALIVSGGGGVGKSYNIKKVLDPYIEAGQNILLDSGKITPVHLYMLLYKYSNEGDIVVLDDVGGIWNSEEAIEILKAALDSKEERWISWRAQSGALAGEDVPSKFLFNGSVIFLTNKDMEAMKETGPIKLRPHMEALMTRSIYLDLQLHTKRQLLLWVNYVTRKANIFVQMGLDKNSQEIALKYLAENRDNLREISLRTIEKLGNFMKSHGGVSGQWRKFANHTLLLKYRPNLMPASKAAAASAPAANEGTPDA